MKGSRNKVAAASDKNTLRIDILEVATKLFIEHGFNGTTLNDIAEQIGVTRTNIYYYFSDKREILEELTKDVFLISELISKKVPNRQSDAVGALRDQVEILARVVLTNPQRYRVIERNETYLAPKTRAKSAAAKRQVYSDFRDTIQKGINAGLFRAVEPSIAALGIIGMCSWAAWWFRPNGKRTIEDTIQALADLAIGSAISADRRQRTRAQEVLRNVRNELDYLEKALPRLSRREKH
jgi:AcrR family transcriptional regulator